jgi:RNA polymerase sigma-70 factor (ECF subfamily)
VVLADQDRDRWDPRLIDEGHALVRQCLRRNTPGPYQFQAAINAVHTEATRFDATDWSQIVALYDQYHAADPNPIVALNRAIAIGERDGPTAGLGELADLALDHYAYFHAARAEFLQRLERFDEADAALDAAVALTTNRVERQHLADRKTEIRDRRRPG